MAKRPGHLSASETANCREAHEQTFLECHRTWVRSRHAAEASGAAAGSEGRAVSVPHVNPHVSHCRPRDKTFTGHCLGSTAHKGSSLTNLLMVGGEKTPQVKMFRLQVQENPFTERRQQIPSAVERTKLSSPPRFSSE